MLYVWERYGVFELLAKFKLSSAGNDGNSFFSQASDAVKNLFFSFSGGSDFKLVEQISLDRPEMRDVPRAPAAAKALLALSCGFNTAKTPFHQNVIISEIAWMGNVADSKNEWLELKNISGKSVDISGWQLFDKDEQIKVIFPSGTKIASGGFFVLERNEEAVPDKSADYLYTGNLRNSEEGLRLFDQNCNLFDEVIAEEDWPAGDNQTKKTMERNFSNLNWFTSVSVGGTAGKENSTLSATITITTTSTSPAFPSSTASSTTITVTRPPPTICSQENLNWPIRSVLINEVAWSGSSPLNGYGSADEWIELKNVSGQTVNLSGWQLINKSGNIKIFFDESDVLNNGDYYLLERTDDDSVPHIPADKFFTNAILNTAESLRLFDQNCQLIDEITANSEWPGGNSYDHRTAERARDLSWQSYYGSGENGIYGTPKKENSIPSAGVGTMPASTSTPPVVAANVFVSEIMAGMDGNANYEFIELYNPGISSVDLTGWSIKKRNSSGTESSFVVSSRLEGKIIPSGKYFLIVNDGGYTGSVSADVSWPSSYTLAYTNNAIILYNAQGGVAEEVSWNEILKNQSWERISFNSNQFQDQPNPNPKNSQNN